MFDGQQPDNKELYDCRQLHLTICHLHLGDQLTWVRKFRHSWLYRSYWTGSSRLFDSTKANVQLAREQFHFYFYIVMSMRTVAGAFSVKIVRTFQLPENLWYPLAWNLVWRDIIHGNSNNCRYNMWRVSFAFVYSCVIQCQALDMYFMPNQTNSLAGRTEDSKFGP